MKNGQSILCMIRWLMAEVSVHSISLILLTVNVKAFISGTVLLPVAQSNFWIKALKNMESPNSSGLTMVLNLFQNFFRNGCIRMTLDGYRFKKANHSKTISSNGLMEPCSVLITGVGVPEIRQFKIE